MTAYSINLHIHILNVMHIQSGLQLGNDFASSTVQEEEIRGDHAEEVYITATTISV